MTTPHTMLIDLTNATVQIQKRRLKKDIKNTDNKDTNKMTIMENKNTDSNKIGLNASQIYKN